MKVLINIFFLQKLNYHNDEPARSFYLIQLILLKKKNFQLYYFSYYDIYEKIITKYKMDPKIFNNKDILKYMEDNNIYICNKNGSVFQKDKEYISLSHMYKKKHSQLSSELSKNTDTYFKDLISILSKKTIKDDCLTDKNIKDINKIL